MSPQIEDMKAVGELLGSVIDSLDTSHVERHPVLRTTRTEEREPISRENRVFVYMRDNFSCVWCGRSDNLTLDHITPWSAGGSDHVDNLRALCWKCNEHRSNFKHSDDNCRPLPLTYYCVDCDTQLRSEYPDADDLPSGPMVPAFCWWHRRAALGIPSREAM